MIINIVFRSNSRSFGDRFRNFEPRPSDKDDTGKVCMPFFKFPCRANVRIQCTSALLLERSEVTPGLDKNIARHRVRHYNDWLLQSLMIKCIDF
ncbi:hypothetical protein TNCV_3449341 [Trichonephila clavipes]|nr:hypothetical protein TNCV_3449341 [Trichonephila clavipes]